MRLKIPAMHFVNRFFGSAWTAFLGYLGFLACSVGVARAEPVALFDGKTFAGWEGNIGEVWRIEDGALTAGSLEKKQEKNDFLATTREFGDFELTLKWKLEGTEGFVNGGVQFRSKRIPDHHEVIGYQADLGAGYDGALYDESRRKTVLAQPDKNLLEKAAKPLGEWNEYRIRAEGPRIRIWLNGVRTVDYTEPDAAIERTGIIAVQIHGNATSVVRYKDIRIEELSGEPTNADEAAARKAAAEQAIDAQYAAWVETLSPERRAWETVLQDQLGSFYLPIHKREKVAGRSNAWDFVEDDPALPRVLLIGDSVSRGYTLAVRKALDGRANVHRAPANCGPTASGLKNLHVWLGDGKWDLIHFNFGIHDRNTPVADYAARLEELVGRLKTTGARLMWATTTPIPDDPEKKQTAASIVERNASAAALMEKHGVAVDDLFAAVTPHLAEYQNPNDVHFNGAGYDFLGQTVARAIESAMK